MMDAAHSSDQHQMRNPSAGVAPTQQLTRLRMVKNKQLLLFLMTLLLVLTPAGVHAVLDAVIASSDTMITIAMSSEDSRYACNPFLHFSILTFFPDFCKQPAFLATFFKTWYCVTRNFIEANR